MANQPAPLPPDGIYRSILLVLVITILAGASSRWPGNTSWPAKRPRRSGSALC